MFERHHFRMSPEKVKIKTEDEIFSDCALVQTSS